MTAFNVTGDAKDVLKDFSRVQRKIVPKAASAAINSTTKKLRTNYVRHQSGAAGIPGKHIRKMLRLTRSKPSHQESILSLVRIRIAAIKLRWSQTAKGIRYAKRIHAGAFQARTVSGHEAIFQRTGIFAIMQSGRHVGKRRETIKQQFANLVEPEPSLRLIGHRTAGLFPTFFTRELTWRLRKLEG